MIEDEDDPPTVVETDEPVVIVVDDSDDNDEAPAVETGDTTVIVADAPASGSTDLDPLTERLVNLERDNQELRERLMQVEITASIAAEDATEALGNVDQLAEQDEEIVEAVDEAIVETLEDAEIGDEDSDGEDEIITDEIAPASSRVHWLFRPMNEWKR